MIIVCQLYILNDKISLKLHLSLCKNKLGFGEKAIVDFNVQLA